MPEHLTPGADPPLPCWLQEQRPPRSRWYYECLAGLTALTALGIVLAF